MIVSTTAVRVAFVAAAAAALAACSPHGSAPPAAGASGDAADVRAVEVQWNKDFKAGDVEPIVSHYSHDAQLMAPGAPVAAGSDAIRAVFITVMSDPKFDFSLATDRVAVASSGDLAYTTGQYAGTMTDPKTHAVVHESGSYVTVYKKAADGDWKAVADITAPGPKAP
jgi:uncharacterized protein (TIGR02246 family)